MFGWFQRLLPQTGDFFGMFEAHAATIRLRFHSDGDRKLSCKTGALNLDYLQKVGWISVPCETARA